LKQSEIQRKIIYANFVIYKRYYNNEEWNNQACFPVLFTAAILCS